MKKSLAQAAAGYLLLSVVMTYPAALHIGDSFMCRGCDGYQNIWNTWWVKRAVCVERCNPHFTKMLWHPDGVSLHLHSLSLVNCLMSALLQTVTSLVAAYNIVLMMTFILAGLGAFWLALEITGDRIASFLAGFVYAFSPFHFAHATGQLHVASIQWTPFFVLFFYRAVRDGRRADRLLGGLCLILGALSCWYHFFYMVATGLLLAGYFALSPARSTDVWSVARRTAPIFILPAALLMPLILAKAGAIQSGDYLEGHNSLIFSADIAGFFIPGIASAYGRWFERIWQEYGGTPSGKCTRIGLAAAVLAGLAIARKPKESGFWALCFVTFVVLSLGPKPQFLGRCIRGVRLPYLYLERTMPGVKATGCPARFYAPASLCLSVLAGIGACSIFERLRPGRRTTAAVAVGAILAAAYIPRPFPLTPCSIVPRTMRDALLDVRDDPSCGTVLNCPSTRWFGLPLYLQTIHQKSMIAGYISREPINLAHKLARHKNVAYLLQGDPRPGFLEHEELLREMKQLDVKYVLALTSLHRHILEDWNGVKPVAAHGNIALYDVALWSRREHADRRPPPHDGRRRGLKGRPPPRLKMPR